MPHRSSLSVPCSPQSQAVGCFGADRRTVVLAIPCVRGGPGAAFAFEVVGADDEAGTDGPFEGLGVGGPVVEAESPPLTKSAVLSTAVVPTGVTLAGL